MTNQANIKKPRILVVEDEDIVARDIKSTLENFGYSVPAIAISGKEAIKIVRETCPDLMLIDIKLSGDMDGIELANKIREHYDVPVIYLTAYSNGKMLQRAKVTEPYGYLTKPFEERELHSTIEMTLYKHKMEVKLKEKEKWYRTTLESIGDAVITTDEKGCITFMNKVAERVTGWQLRESIGKDVKKIFKIVDEKTHKSIENPVKEVISKGITMKVENRNIVAKNGEEIPISDSVAPIRNEAIELVKDGREVPIVENVTAVKNNKGEITGCVLVFCDVSVQKQAEMDLLRKTDELKLMNEELVRLTMEMTRIEEKEREKLAEWLHEGIGQNLVAIKMAFETGKNTPTTLPLINKTIQSTRSLTKELYPTIYDKLGLTEAIEEYIDTILEPRGITASLNIDKAVARLKDDLKRNIFRITRECLQNILKHASASRVNVEIKKDKGHYQIKVKDNGVGFVDEKIKEKSSRGIGLKLMKGWVKSLKGHLNINSQPGKGTEISIAIPIEQ